MSLKLLSLVLAIVKIVNVDCDCTEVFKLRSLISEIIGGDVSDMTIIVRENSKIVDSSVLIGCLPEFPKLDKGFTTTRLITLNNISALHLSLKFKKLPSFRNTLAVVAEEAEDIPGILNQIASSGRPLNAKHGGFNKKLPSVIIFVTKNKSQSQAEIKKLVLLKTDKRTLETYRIDGVTFVAFLPLGPDKFDLADVWELYSVKNRTFFDRLKVTEPESFQESRVSRRQDWMGAEFTAAVFFEHLKETSELSIEAFEVNVGRDATTGEYFMMNGLSVDIFKDFESALNFTGRVHQPFESGIRFKNAMRDYRDEIDILVSHYGLIPQRLQFAQTLLPTYFDGVEAFFVQPPAHDFRNIHTAPFSSILWATIAVTWLIITSSLRFICWVRQKLLSSSCDTQFGDNIGYYENVTEDDGREEGSGIDEKDKQVTRDVFWWAIAASCQQGWHMTPSTIPSRSVFFSGLVFSFLCYAAYTATIVSELWATVLPIKNLEVLLGTARGIFVEENSDVAEIAVNVMLQRNPEMAHKVRITNKKTAVENLLKSDKGLNCFLNWPENVGFAQQAFKNVTRSQPNGVNSDVLYCEHVSRFPYKYLPLKAAMFIPKNSPFKRILNYRILIGLERGFLRRYWNEYRKNTVVRCLKQKKKGYALGMYDSWVVFAILFCGYVLSLTILVLEIFIKCKPIESFIGTRH